MDNYDVLVRDALALLDQWDRDLWEDNKGTYVMNADLVNLHRRFDSLRGHVSLSAESIVTKPVGGGL